MAAACTAGVGPEFFNFTAALSEWSPQFPGLNTTFLWGIATWMTSTQENWMHAVCSAGFQIRNCFAHPIQTGHGCGEDLITYPYVGLDGLNQLVAAGENCCDATFWQGLQHNWLDPFDEANLALMSNWHLIKGVLLEMIEEGVRVAARSPGRSTISGRDERSAWQLISQCHPCDILYRMVRWIGQTGANIPLASDEGIIESV
eukprot:TRINITY_DN31616_c0_g1_i2.p1 TRINITY_DN31616_c0_g1~~TRINITY_DN31616_c0_g1_i2.p1  ORF type:complete len:202 (-),score=12.44 TRINITY_DN31616_c0_g1_i2:120-725(-)